MKIKILIITMIILLSHTLLFSQWDYGFDFSKAGSAGLQFLKIGVGAREAGIGEAVISVSKDINSIFWNPAGIAYIDDMECNLSYSDWMLDIRHSALGIGKRFGNFGVIGISLLNLSLPKFEETTVQMQDGTGRMVSAGDYAIGLAIARRFTNKLSMGGQLRYVREELDQDSFSNVLLDIGAIYHTGYRNLHVAVCAQHFGPDIKMLRDRFRMPLVFKVGISDDIISLDYQRITLAIDLVHPTDNTERMNFGLEYGLFDWIFMRGGYRLNSDLGNWSFGAGLKKLDRFLKGSVDYSYTDFGDIMGAVNRFSVSFTF